MVGSFRLTDYLVSHGMRSLVLVAVAKESSLKEGTLRKCTFKPFGQQENIRI